MARKFEVVAWRLRSVMAERNVRFATDLHRRLGEVLGPDTPSSVQVARLVRGTPGRLTMRVLDGLCVALDCTPDDLLAATPSIRPAGSAVDTPAPRAGDDLIDVDVLGGPRTVQGIADVAGDRGIPSWPTEAAFIAENHDRRHPHFILGNLLDAPHDRGEWVLKHVAKTHEVYAYRTPPAAERFALANNPEWLHSVGGGRIDGTGDEWGPCYLLGYAYNQTVTCSIERANISHRPGAIAWINGRLTLLNSVLRDLVITPPAGGLEDDLRRYVYALNDQSSAALAPSWS